MGSCYDFFNMTRSTLITLFVLCPLIFGQNPRELLNARCPCLARLQCINLLGDDDFDDDEIFRSIPVCPLSQVPCCTKFQIRSVIREAFSGSPPPLVNTGRDLIPGPAIGPTAGELDLVGRVFDAQGAGNLDRSVEESILAGLAIPDVPSAGGPAGNLDNLSEEAALAGLQSLAAELARPENIGSLPTANVPVPVQVPAAPVQLPLPAEASAVPVQVAAVPAAPSQPLPVQAPGPQAPSVKIIGPQPIYISSDKVIGPEVDYDGDGHAGQVQEGRPQLSEEDLQILNFLRSRLIN